MPFAFVYYSTTEVALILGIFSIQVVIVSSLLNAVNVITTMFNMRVVGLKLFRVPLFCWSLLIACIVILVLGSVLAGGFDRVVFN